MTSDPLLRAAKRFAGHVEARKRILKLLRHKAAKCQYEEPPQYGDFGRMELRGVEECLVRETDTGWDRDEIDEEFPFPCRCCKRKRSLLGALRRNGKKMAYYKARIIKIAQESD